MARLMSPTRGLVRGFFTSDALWTELREHFAQEKAGKKILGYTGEKLDEFIELWPVSSVTTIGGTCWSCRHACG